MLICLIFHIIYILYAFDCNYIAFFVALNNHHPKYPSSKQKIEPEAIYMTTGSNIMNYCYNAVLPLPVILFTSANLKGTI